MHEPASRGVRLVLFGLPRWLPRQPGLERSLEMMLQNKIVEGHNAGNCNSSDTAIHTVPSLMHRRPYHYLPSAIIGVDAIDHPAFGTRCISRICIRSAVETARNTLLRSRR